MIKIFEPLAKEFSSNGLIVLSPISSKEVKKKSLNGWYIEAEIDVKYKKYLKKDYLMIVKTKSKLNPQAFRIDSITENTSSISIIANHVMFDTENYHLIDVRPTDLSAGNALSYLNDRTDEQSPFQFSSDISNINTLYVENKDLLEAMKLVEERWGGFYDADNYSITLRAKLGYNNGEVIRKNKNLISRVITEDWSGVVTKLYPTGPEGLTLPEKYLNSTQKYVIPYTRHIDFDFEVEENATEEEKINKLREIAQEYLDANKNPKVCYELTANLQKIDIGDTVRFIDQDFQIDTEVQEYEYDLNTKKIINIIFGNYTRDVKKKFTGIKDIIIDITKTISKQGIMIRHQTDLINNLNKNGIIQITDNEFLIVDKIPIQEAKNVWRWGLGGLGFSSNGYEGPFETAITMDGAINANFITAGKMSTDRIEGLNELLLEVKNNLSFQKKAEGTSHLIINDAYSTTLLKFSIIGNMELLYPSEDLYPSDDLYPLDSFLIIENDKAERKKIHLPLTHLYYLDEHVYDEFLIEDKKAKVIRKVGWSMESEIVLNDDLSSQLLSLKFPSVLGTFGNYVKGLIGSEKYLISETFSNGINQVILKNKLTQEVVDVLYSYDETLQQTTINLETYILPADFGIVTYLIEETNPFAKPAIYIKKYGLNKWPLESETTETLEPVEIQLFSGYNKIYLESFFDQELRYTIEYKVKNNLTDNFVQEWQMQSSINLLENSIISSVQAKIDGLNKELKAELKLEVDPTNLVSKINASADIISLRGNRFIVDSDFFKLSADGKMQCTSGKIGSWNISSEINNGYEWGKGKCSGLGQSFDDSTFSDRMAFWAADGKFKVTYGGYLYAENAQISGNINAKSGLIGGWSIDDVQLKRVVGRYSFEIRSDRSANEPCLLVFDTQSGKYNFYVRPDGYLYAETGTFNGTINAKSGTIGGFNINGTSLYYGNTAINRNGNVEFRNDNGYFSVGNGGVYLTGSGANRPLILSDMLGVSGTGDSNSTIAIRALYGQIRLASNYGVNVNGQIYGGSSSRATKKNIKKLSIIQIEELEQLIEEMNFYSYDYKKNYSMGKKNNYGFLIDEIENTKLSQLLHVFVDEKNPKYKTYNNEDLTRILLIVVQSLIKKIDNLERRTYDNKH